MRVAFSGAQRVGKSTLIERLGASLPDHDRVDEPYLLLEEEGHLFSHPPSPEDFVAQVERSLAEVDAAGPDVLFDRCPLDFLAYLLAEGEVVDDLLARATGAMARLDLVVFVPIESPDRIVLPRDEDGGQRTAVDDELSRLLFEEDVAPDVLAVGGDLESRVRQVLARFPGYSAAIRSK